MGAIPYRCYLDILQRELKCAVGCTEPVALAFAAAKAREVLGVEPDHLTLSCSGNVVKNAKAVVVPHAGGRRGMEIAGTLGCLAGDASRKLEVLAGVTEEACERASVLVAQGFCTVALQEGVEGLFIEATVEGQGHACTVRVAGGHTDVVRIVRDGETLFDVGAQTPDVAPGTPPDTPGGSPAALTATDQLSSLNVADIVAFADAVALKDIEPLFRTQIECNMEIADEGLRNAWGCQVGRTILAAQGDSVQARAKAKAAAGSDARMNGCALPVVINSGSGNQGMTASIPVIEYAREMEVSEEQLMRALCVSNLVAQDQKRFIGLLSAYCGAVCAAAGAGAALTYLRGGTYGQIADTITNTIGAIGGMVCDGAKSSCAAKIASAVDAAILAHEMSMAGQAFAEGEGLVQKDVEDTISAFGYVGREGMRQTDIEILKVMTGEQEL